MWWIETFSNPYSWPYLTHEAGSWPYPTHVSDGGNWPGSFDLRVGDRVSVWPGGIWPAGHLTGGQLTYLRSNRTDKKLSYRWQTARCCFVKLLRYRRTFCQTRWMWLPDGEKNSNICLFVLTWSTNVTDRRTDRQTEEQTDTAWQHRPRLPSVARYSHHIPVYLQQFPSYSNHNCKKIAIFTYPGLHFLFALGKPLWQSRKTLHEWKHNSVLAKPLAACTYLFSIVSELYDA